MTKIIFISIALIFTFSGCITTKLPSYKTYSLQNTNNVLYSNKYIKKSILVMTPNAMKSLNNPYIIYYNDDLKKEVYALSKWSDSPVKMIQEKIVNDLSDSKHYSLVSYTNFSKQSDISIKTELITFSQKFEKKHSFAQFKIRVYLIDNSTKKILSKTFFYTKTCKTNDAKGVVEGLNTISNQFTKDLDSFILSEFK